MTGRALIVQADALRLPLPDGAVHAIVCDPPYSLSFMGRQWDSFGGPQAFQAWCQQWATDALRVLKPGGWLLAFGGTRTWHRLACGLEDAGFEMRDTTAEFSPSYGPLAWVHGQGFPKGKGCLKPAWEPVIVARRPGSSVLQIDASRIGHATPDDLAASQAKNPGRSDLVTSDVYGAGRPQQSVNSMGRWPPNVALIHSEGCQPTGTRKIRSAGWNVSAPVAKKLGSIYAQDAYSQTMMSGERTSHADADGMEEVTAWTCEEDCPVFLLDQQSGERPGSKPGTIYKTPRRPNEIYNGGGWHDGIENQKAFGYGDQGGASRFMYTAKAGRNERVTIDGEGHPTVKPLALMRWLVRLVTPPGGTVLDMFAGSGTTGEAAMLEGFHSILIDKDPTNLPSIQVRTHPYVRRTKVVTNGHQTAPEQGRLL